MTRLPAPQKTRGRSGAGGTTDCGHVTIIVFSINPPAGNPGNPVKKKTPLSKKKKKKFRYVVLVLLMLLLLVAAC